MVNSFQLPFMRSRKDIQRSACSCRGMPSHRFSMLARVGLEMAWVDEARETTALAGTLRTRPLRSRLDAGVRSMLESFSSRGRERSLGAIAVVDEDFGVGES